MTWAQLFNFSTIEHRHLFLAYLIEASVQMGYLGWVLRGLLRTPVVVLPADDAERSRRG